LNTPLALYAAGCDHQDRQSRVLAGRVPATGLAIIAPGPDEAGLLETLG
jgi:hypothetical protein